MADLRVPSLNMVIIAGRVVRDPEYRSTTSGRLVARFTLANNRRYRARDGTPQEEALYVNVVAWDRQAEYAHQNLRKGRPIIVEGRLRLDEWVDATQQRRSRIEIVARNITPLDWLPSEAEAVEPEEFPVDEGIGDENRTFPNTGKTFPRPNAQPNYEWNNDYPEDDVPF